MTPRWKGTNHPSTLKRIGALPTTLNVVVPCRYGRCGRIATAFMTLEDGRLDAGYFCSEHLPEGWKLAEGEIGDTDTD